MRGADVGYPVAHCFVDGIFQSARSRVDATNLGAQQPHAKNIQLLAAHILGAHVHDALKSKQRTDGCSRDPVLPGAGFSDHAMLAHAFDQQALTDAVVYFVGAGVQQVFALQINFCAAQLFGQSAREKQRRWPSCVCLQQFVEACLEARVFFRPFVLTFQFFERSHESFRDVATSPWAEAAGLNNQGWAFGFWSFARFGCPTFRTFRKVGATTEIPALLFSDGCSCH